MDDYILEKTDGRPDNLEGRPEIRIMCHYLFGVENPECPGDIETGDPEFEAAITAEAKAEVVLRRLFATGVKPSIYCVADGGDASG